MLYAGAGICWFITLMVIGFILVFNKKIKTLVNLLRIAAVFARNNFSIYLMPVC